MGKKISYPVQMTGQTNYETNSQLLDKNVLRSVINMEVVKDGELSKRLDTVTYDANLNTYLQSNFSAIHKIVSWENRKYAISDEDSGSPLFLIFGLGIPVPIPNTIILAVYKSSSSWKGTLLTDDNITFPITFEDINVVVRDSDVLIADNTNRLYRIYIDKLGVIGMAVVGIPIPQTLIQISNPQYTEIDSDGTTDTYYDGGTENRRGTIFGYCYTLKTDDGDESNPSPINYWIQDRYLDGTDDTVIGFESFVKSLDLDNLTVPSDIDPYIKDKLKYFGIYRIEGVFTNSKMQTLGVPKLIKILPIGTKDGANSYTDNNINGLTDVSTENDIAPICKDVVSIGKKIVIANIANKTKFLWGFENAQEILITNESDREFINIPVAITLDENDLDIDFSDYFNASEKYKRTIRFFASDMVTPLRARMWNNQDNSQTKITFMVIIPLLRRGGNSIFFAWSDADDDKVPTEFVSNSIFEIEPPYGNGSSYTSEVTISDKYGMIYDFVHDITGGNNINDIAKWLFMDNFINAIDEGIIFSLTPMVGIYPQVDKSIHVNWGGTYYPGWNWVSESSHYGSFVLPLLNKSLFNLTEYSSYSLFPEIALSGGDSQLYTLNKTYNFPSTGFLLFEGSNPTSATNNNSDAIIITDNAANTLTLAFKMNSYSHHNYVSITNGTDTDNFKEIGFPNTYTDYRNIAVLLTWDKGDSQGHIYVINPSMSNNIFGSTLSSSIFDDLIGNIISTIEINSNTGMETHFGRVVLGSGYIDSEAMAQKLIGGAMLSKCQIGNEISITKDTVTFDTLNIKGACSIKDNGTNTITITYSGDVLVDIVAGNYVVLTEVSNPSFNDTPLLVASNNSGTITINSTIASLSLEPAYCSKVLETGDITSLNADVAVYIVNVYPTDTYSFLYFDSTPTIISHADGVLSNILRFGIINGVYSGIIKLALGSGTYSVSSTQKYISPVGTFTSSLPNPMYITTRRRSTYDPTTVYADLSKSNNAGTTSLGWGFELTIVTDESFDETGVTLGERITSSEKNENNIQYAKGEFFSFPDMNYKINDYPIKRIIKSPTYLPYKQSYGGVVIAFSSNNVAVIQLDDNHNPTNITHESDFGLVSDKSLIVTPYGIFWLSNEGIVRWDNNGIRLINRINTENGALKIINIPINEDIKSYYIAKRKQAWFYYTSSKISKTEVLSFSGNVITTETNPTVSIGEYIEISGDTSIDGIYRVLDVDLTNKEITVDAYFPTTGGTVTYTVKDVVYVYDIINGEFWLFVDLPINTGTDIIIDGIRYNLFLDFNMGLTKYPYGNTLTSEYSEIVKEIRQYYSDINKVLVDFDGSSVTLNSEAENNRFALGGYTVNGLSISSMEYRRVGDGIYGYRLKVKVKGADKIRNMEIILIQRGGIEQ